MKLQDALKRIFREFGMNVLKEKRFVFLLSDYNGSGEDCLNYAVRLRKSLSADRNFKPELAGFAVDCILFAMGLISSVREPSDHGFDPCGNGTPSQGQICSGTKSDGRAAPDDSMEILSDSWTAPAETSVRAQNPLGVEIQKTSKATVTSPFGNMSAGTGTHVADQNQDIAVTHGSQQPSGDSPAKAVNLDRIGRMEFWVKNILYSLLTVGLFSLSFNIRNSFPNLANGLSGLSIIGFLYYAINVWEGRAHDLGEKGNYACAFVFCAYFSLLIFCQLFCALFLQTTDSVILSLVLSVPGGYLWIKYGFVKGIA